MITTRRTALLSLAALPMAACVNSARGGPPPRGTARDVATLSLALAALGPGVDPAEARRVADLAIAETHRLALAYGIEDAALVHNAKVNTGRKPRGLCWHWAEDLETALERLDLRSMTLHRGIANYDRAFRIEHSSVIVSARGAAMMEGLVLDPWRKGGVLTWIPAAEDRQYPWEPQLAVHRARYEERVARGEAPAGYAIVKP
ncbi:hypothetical protein JQC91_16410 [Jannaschia sp. Os4]|uniref:hypothetical protein n=1 Tax=Jannaschia sp. Os4 TaxID=2807617 RepID=UPI00193A70E5|nr:hypothetical protein [Jannaschia sp. Os4]MBM2577892.1 hypothetical protein [Jannaschia sp. Os4]